jgi:hypothetical protein
LQQQSELRQRLGINGIGLGAFEQRLGKVVGLCGIDHADHKVMPH